MHGHRGSAPPTSPARRRAALPAGAGLLLAALAGCDSPGPLAVDVPSGVRLEGNTVVWASARPALAAIRYGARSGRYDAVAYPSAVGRADKAFATEHRVPILGAVSGDTVYVQPVETSASGVVAVGEERRFVMPARAATPLLAWTMIDVGFGDAHLIATPAGVRVLVDGGERRDEANVERYLESEGVSRLDVVLGTHIHEDHIGGFVGSNASRTDGIIGGLEIGRFLDAPSHSGSRWAWDELVATLSGVAPIATIAPGDDDRTNPALAWDPAVRVWVLNAGDGRAIGGEDEGDWINNDSIVLRIGFGAVDFVLGGDAESPVQWRLAPLGQAIESEVLKVHHHGASDATEPVYLDAVNPRVAVIPITVYETWNGSLPSAIVLERLHARRLDVFASDRAEPLGIMLAGDRGHHVTTITDGSSYEVRVATSATVHVPGIAGAGGETAGRPAEEDLP